jgi:F-type H+-transporting ATPase subunit b
VQIDWFTVGAQLVNFAILLGLLAKFLYRPILDAVESRQQRIQQQLDASEEAKREAEARRAEYREKIEGFERRRDDAFSELEREVEARRADLLEEVRQEVQQTRRRWLRRFRGEQRRLMEAYRDRLADELFAGLRHAVADLADRDLEALIARKFTEQLRTVDPSTRRDIEQGIEASASSGAGLAVTVESRWDLPPDRRAEIEGAFEEILGRAVEVEFVREDDLLAGIEFHAAGHRFGWSLRSYLEGLRAQLDAVVAEQMTSAEAAEEEVS